MKSITLPDVAGLEVRIHPRALSGTLALWLVFTLLAAGLLRFTLPAAVLGGLAAALLHWLFEFLHHLGHAAVARAAGHPMKGLRVGALYVLAQSVYPFDEGALPDAVHLQRALGGPAISFLLALTCAVLAPALRPFGSLAWVLGLYSVASNLLVFCLGALMPFPFTDGGTLLAIWRRRDSK